MLSASVHRRRFLQFASSALGTCCCAGCIPSGPPSADGQLEAVWGQRGSGKGQLQKPRAIAIDAQDQLYIVDMTGRIQVFDDQGQFLRGWRSPEIANGKPSGLSFDQQGHLLVADTHYFRILVYTPRGVLLEHQTIGGTNGLGPGEFNFVTDAVQDQQGNYYVSEYGQFDRIQKFSASRQFLMQWGSPGAEPQQFLRPQNLVLDKQDRLWVVDACNHRVKQYDPRGDGPPRLLRIWGDEGEMPGQMRYPYDLVVTEELVYVCEFGNHRVQKFTLDGQWLAAWGGPGTQPGQLSQPWALAIDSQQRLHVLDSYNHRVQRIRL